MTDDTFFQSPLPVRHRRPFPARAIRRLLVRGTNWIGDAILTLPAMAAIREGMPEARITVLAKPWVGEVYRICPHADEVLTFQEPGIHAGVPGRLRLARDLRGMGFDGAILLQNAIEAALVTLLAGIPVRAGYNTDARGLLLTSSVRRSREILRVHQSRYYLEMVRALGFPPPDPATPLLVPPVEYGDLAEKVLRERGCDPDAPLAGIAPGAAYGPAKRWYPDRFAAVADSLADEFGARILVFGSAGDRDSTEAVQAGARTRLVDLAGRTSLREALALISRCRIFVSNDSGLMHVAAALGIPTVAIFGSTNPVTTGPMGPRFSVIRRPMDCSPCLRETCPEDFRCMSAITAEDVLREARSLFGGGR
ncbi:MAG: lipopolysaccharide heptosyltransferase II [Deltaproteobacteria bacterium HGW-Deltaproteobacteria-19]|nr:MAG: lipopolysaccharide heptosyltransferase II [Deltaproteobacteria bacterium HGW-Deltaproteobacteria-19]